MNNYLIIGRTNVGKSYFFNLFTKDRKTISINQPHTTVDIIKQKILTKESLFNIYDTPGYDDLKNFNLIFNRIKHLDLNNIEFIYVVKDEYKDIDLQVSKKIHALKFPLVLYLNSKIKKELDIVSNLYNSIYRFNEDGFTEIRKNIIYDKKNILKEDETINKSVSIFGKENTGKSTLFNILVNKELALTHNSLHTTRDAVEWAISYKNLNLDIIDTAGFIRAKSNRKRGIVESLSIKQSEQSLYNSDLIILMLEATSESRLDLTLIGELQKKNKDFMLLVNKIDLVEDQKAFQDRFLKHLSNNHNFFSSLNIYFISALNTSQRKILELIYNRIVHPFQFKTSYLNKVAIKMNIEL
ncbi:MAG: 50S ribosome-binding GTPase, partial [Proteobacteria bacterium]|nr:50S ribosome-binding GTPase [Pseudomonadota bacterium]